MFIFLQLLVFLPKLALEAPKLTPENWEILYAILRLGSTRRHAEKQLCEKMQRGMCISFPASSSGEAEDWSV